MPSITLPNEFALAVECCRAAFNPAPAIERLAGQVGWPNFLAVTRRHRIEALAWQALRLTPMPGAAADRLAGDARRIAEHNLRCAAESQRLLTQFDKAGIACLFVKGVTLGKIAYGNPLLKMGWDIDLLVGQRDVTAAARVLTTAEYRPVVPDRPGDVAAWHRTRKESVWRHATGLVVELHGRLADNPRMITGIDATSPRQVVDVMPGIALPTLAVEELFAYLCVHGASSAWFRLKWLSDLAALVAPFETSERRRLYRRSQELGAGRSADQAMILLARLFDMQTFDPAREKPVPRWMADRAIGQLLAKREPTARPLGTATIHLTQFALRPGLTFKMTELIRQAREAAGNLV